MAKLGEAFVVIKAKLDPLKKGLARARAVVTRAMRSISATIRRMARSAVRATKIISLAFIALGIASIKMAADVEESENLFEVSMGSMADTTRKWSETISKALGLSAFDVRKMVSVFNVMLESMGIAPKEAVKMSKSLTLLANDMASFFNLKPEIAFLKLQSGITGEIEPLKRLGILVNDNTIKQFAYNNGIAESGAELTEIQKIQARYGAILNQTRKAQGDLLRTLDSTTNVFRTIKSLGKDVAVIFGNDLLPIVTRLGVRLRDFLKNNQDQIKQWSVTVADKVDIVVSTFEKWIESLRSGDVKTAIDKMVDDIIDTLNKLLDKAIPVLIPVAEILGQTIGRAMIKGIVSVGGNFLKKFGKEVFETFKAVGEIPVAAARAGSLARSARNVPIKAGQGIGGEQDIVPILANIERNTRQRDF